MSAILYMQNLKLLSANVHPNFLYIAHTLECFVKYYFMSSNKNKMTFEVLNIPTGLTFYPQPAQFNIYDIWAY